MAENQVTVEKTKGQKFKANLKEWCRKKVVGLKRSPQNIALIFLVASTIFFLLCLFPISQALYECNQEKEYIKVSGLCAFITTLLSLLVLVSFLNAFPKRKKANIFFVALVFAMIAAMIVCDVMIYLELTKYLASGKVAVGDSIYVKVNPSCPFIMTHIILLGVSAVVFALLPVYSMLIRNINTKVELESATENMHGEIDIQEE